MDSTKLVEAAITEQTERIFNDGLLARKQEISTRRNAVRPLNLFESRGSAMLKAALSDKGRQESKAPLKERSPAIIEDEQKVRLMRQAAELKNRKRSPKNNVLFSEPVVTQEYKYEPTFFDDFGSDVQENSSLNSNENGRELHPERSITDRESNLTNYVQATESKQLESLLDDGKDEIFIMKSSGHNEEKSRTKSATKRPYESIRDSDEESRSSANTESGDGSLFFSPKVAKIAPYFDEQPQERRVSADFRNAHTQRRVSHDHQRSRSTRICQTKSGQMNLSKRTASYDSLAGKSASQLLSYKKIQINEQDKKVENGVNQEESVSASQRYFGWLTNGFSFLSNQMNKLIF